MTKPGICVIPGFFRVRRSNGKTSGRQNSGTQKKQSPEGLPEFGNLCNYRPILKSSEPSPFTT